MRVSAISLDDLRTCTEQYGDVIQAGSVKSAYIMTHGVSGVDWKQYKHPLPEYVYDIYTEHWLDVCFVW